MERIIKTLSDKSHEDVVKKIFTSNQHHVFDFWHELDEIKRQYHIERLSKVDYELLAKLIKENIEGAGQDKKGREIAPAPIITLPKTKEEHAIRKKAIRMGESALRKGQIAIFLVAGGQGSRLGFEGPKGMFRPMPLSDKSLFQLFAEKIKATENRYSTKLPWFIMTSEENDQQTKDFFSHNSYFGLKKENVFIFRQGMIPAIDIHGRLVLKDKHELFMNPNGHGGSLLALYMSGAIAEMKRRKIKHLFYFQVDNPLIIMADPEFIGYHIMNKADMSAKVLPKASPEEKVGAYAYVNGRLSVIEYSDLTNEEMYARDDKGNLLYGAGNIAIHVLDVGFVERLNKGGFKLPYHVARKKIDSHKGAIDGIKFETFVFDAFGEASSYALVEVNREDNFAPVKNKEGVDSPESAKAMITEQGAKWLEAAKVKVPKTAEGKVDGTIEISPMYALDKEEFVRRYKGKPKLSSGFNLYIG